jgi:hypothetical protein
MPANLGVSGGPELRYVAAKLRKAAVRDMTVQLRKGQRKAFAPLEKAIKAEAAATLPKRGGYNAIMSKAVKVSVTTRLVGSAAVTARVYARGKNEDRDVRQINAGVLRHPRFGARSTGNWYTTRVRSGFVDRPVADLADRVLEESAEAVGKILREIASA